MGTSYMIVGASAAGMACAHTVRKNDPGAVITVLSDESFLPYFRPMIPYVITGKKSGKDIQLNGSGIFTQSNIDVRLKSPVTSLDLNDKTVATAEGEILDYDKILFASGSRPYLPDNIEGLDNKGVFCLKTLADAQGMAQRSDDCDHVVMLGGGILNLKAAFALLEKGLKVTLVVYSPEVLSQLMDPEDAFLVRNALDSAGLEIITGTSATNILADPNGVCAVALDNGLELPCGMVCIGKGVVPNIDFLKDSNIETDKGVVTDPYTACSEPDTFAAGDVAVALDPGTGQKTVTSLWTHAVEMGICAGLNMTGTPTAYNGTLGIMNATQVAGEPFVSMGIVHTKGKDLETHVLKSNKTFRKIVFSKDGTKLVGSLFIGDITNAGIYRYVIREQKNITTIKDQLINHTIHYGYFM